MNIRNPWTRLSLFAFVAGTCFAFAPGAVALADEHGSGGDEHAAPKHEEPAEHGGGSEGGSEGHGEAKPAFPPPPAAKTVSLKTPPAATQTKKESVADTKGDPKSVKSATNFKPAPKPTTKTNTTAADEPTGDTPKNADEALSMLREGNQRWMDGNVQNPSTGMLRRKTTSDSGQKPFAIVLTCADSRIPVERVFDRGVGELFVARVAGNVTGPHESGTIEYAAEHLSVPLLVVMGHSKCGAVKATVENAQVTPNIASLVDSIKPAVERARKLNPSLEGAELIDASVRENVWQSVFDLYKSSPLIVEAVRSGKLKVVGAVVDISTGKVDWMGEHPWQEAIVGAFASKNGEASPAEAKPATKTADAEPKAH
ncbi:MAG: carbonic anhydrase [Phycisphaerales bacterium]